jgi:hypothetical protein
VQGDFRKETNDAVDFNTHRETDSYFQVEKDERLSVVVKNNQHVRCPQRCRCIDALRVGEKREYLHKRMYSQNPLSFKQCLDKTEIEKQAFFTLWGSVNSVKKK